MLRNSKNIFFRCFIFTTFFIFTFYDGLTSEAFLQLFTLFYNLLLFYFWVGGKRAEIPQKNARNLR